MTLPVHVVRAQWVIPLSQPPIENGYVALQGKSIIEVGSGRPTREKVQDLGHAAILPAFVNAHTHLEFSLLDEPLGQRGIAFADWLRLVIEYRRQRDREGPQQHLAAIARGINECRECGAGLFGEISSSPWPEADYSDAVVFLEQLGLDAGIVDERFQAVAERCRTNEETLGSACVNWGLSPHSPYSVHRELMRSLILESQQRRRPLAIHVAESRAEAELTSNRTGPLAEFLRELGAWSGSHVFCGVDEIIAALPRTARHLLIHGNYLSDAQIGDIASRSDFLSVVYCPRTHAYFAHEPYPLMAMLAQGINVAVGTDSRASNPDLSVWRELQTIAALHTSIPPEIIVRLGTYHGAWALGREADYGTIEPGKNSDLNVISFGETVRRAEVWERLFQHDAQILRPNRHG